MSEIFRQKNFRKFLIIFLGLSIILAQIYSGSHRLSHLHIQQQSQNSDFELLSKASDKANNHQLTSKELLKKPQNQQNRDIEAFCLLCFLATIFNNLILPASSVFLAFLFGSLSKESKSPLHFTASLEKAFPRAPPQFS